MSTDWCATNSFEFSLHCVLCLVVVNHCWFVADWVRDGIVGKWKNAYSRRYIQAKYMNEAICVSSCVRRCVRFSYSVNKCEYMRVYEFIYMNVMGRINCPHWALFYCINRFLVYTIWIDIMGTIFTVVRCYCFHFICEFSSISQCCCGFWIGLSCWVSCFF